MMERRTLGRTGLRVSVLGFGCGDVGGLIVRGTPAERERGVARAIELGVNYFDTAPSYGGGQSESNLGQTLRTVGARVTIGTKFRLEVSDRGDIAGAVARSLDASLRRLGMDSVDILQCHNRLVLADDGQGLPVQVLLAEILPALGKLRDAGKIRFWGITALGQTEALHEAIDSGVLDTAQVCLNLLNPSAAVPVPDAFPAQNFHQLLERTRSQRMGTMVIRVLAAGALSGTIERHPIAASSVAPIASGPDYAADVARARALQALVDEGHATSLVEASIRFALAQEGVSTVLAGVSSIDHLEAAARAVARGALSSVALQRCAALWRDLA